MALVTVSSPAFGVFSTGNLDGMTYVPVEVQSGEDFMLTTHGLGGATPVTFGGCLGASDDGAPPTLTWFPEDTAFPSQTDSFANAGPLPWTRTVNAYAADFNGDCSTAPQATPTYTASVTVLPATALLTGVDGQETVAGQDETQASASPYFFDLSGGLAWSLADVGSCPNTEPLPSGLAIDTSLSTSGEVPPVRISGTPELGTLGVHQVCLALTDTLDNTGFAVLTVAISAAPTLADTGTEEPNAMPLVAGVILVLAGFAVVVYLRRFLRDREGSHR